MYKTNKEAVGRKCFKKQKSIKNLFFIAGFLNFLRVFKIVGN